MKKNKLSKTQRQKKSARKSATNAEKQKRRVAKKNKQLRAKAKITSMVMEKMGSTKKARVQKLAEKQTKQPWKDTLETSVVMCSDCHGHNHHIHDHQDHAQSQDISEQEVSSSGEMCSAKEYTWTKEGFEVKDVEIPVLGTDAILPEVSNT